MKRILSFIVLALCLNLQAAEELSIGQVADDLYSKMDYLGIANDKPLNLTLANHDAVSALRKETTFYASELLRRIAEANFENPQYKAFQFELLNSRKELLSIKKSSPLVIKFRLHIAGYVQSQPKLYTMTIHGEKVQIDGLEFPVKSKFEKANDDSRSKEFKDIFTSHPDVGKTPGKVQSI